jgi:magnesium-protoporphyrin IX monomethyl ester (oxidative) cyclase
MDILFIDPPWIIESDTNLWKQVRSCWPTLGIAYIASYLEQSGFSCRIIDCTAERIAVHDIEKHITCESPRFIGITATTPLIRNGLEIAEICKAFFPKAKVVFGGVHPTVLAEEVLQDENVDYVVRGEGYRLS